MKLVWYRNDLRVHAHRPLAEAMAGQGPVAAVYCLCRRQWESHCVAPLRQWYVLKSLLELGAALAERGVDLHVLDTEDFTAVAPLLRDFADRYRVTDVYCSREYPFNEMQRDRAVTQTLQARGVRMHGFDDSVLVPPLALSTGKGTPYTIFGAYKRRWQAYLHQGAVQVPSVPARADRQGQFHGRSLVEKALAELAVPSSLTAQWQPGERAAQQQLQQFVDTTLAAYAACRDYPAQPGTSRLSVALSAGTLSPWSCYQLARQVSGDPACREGADCWLNELAWRDFYRQIIARFPRLSQGAAFKPETQWLAWSDDKSLFAAWCEGRTGYPLVDAAMRQLVETGWMHNRLRMLTAMFLTKHLFINWRWGEAFFMHHLIDGDFAANNGGWQWSASTGTDAVPYFRVFNPVRQSRRFDPQGRFIARYLPELSSLDNVTIHEPWTQPLLAPDYPAPCVPCTGVKERVAEAFQAAKQQYNAQQEALR